MQSLLHTDSLPASFKILLQHNFSEVAPGISHWELGYGEGSLTLEQKLLL